MANTAPEATTKSTHIVDDPELTRMSIGDHVEELRRRLVLALVGFVVALAVCMYFGNEVVAIFCRPLLMELKNAGLPPWTVDRELSGSFSVYLHISLITATAISAPWWVYQVWQFVAAGLYRHERQWVTRYAPLSIILLVCGMLFVYFAVLPPTIRFFVGWTSAMPVPQYVKSPEVTPTVPMLNVPVLEGDPKLSTLKDGDMYYNKAEAKLNIVVGGALRAIPFAPMSLVVPNYELRDYIDLVVMMLLMFGLAFELPLVIVALVRIGIFEPRELRAARRYVYFVLLIIAAVVTPGDVITATMALVVPLILLYEFGVFLGARGQRLEESSEVSG